MDDHPLIAADPAILVGKPVLRGTRLSVELILGMLAEGASFEQVKIAYPQLTDMQIRACLAYANDLVKAERVFPSAA